MPHLQLGLALLVSVVAALAATPDVKRIATDIHPRQFSGVINEVATAPSKGMQIVQVAD